MQMPPRYVGLSFQIDTNRINSRQREEAMNQLETWACNGVIELDMSERAFNESISGHNKGRVAKAMKYIGSFDFAETHEEREQLRRIAEILFPGGVTKQSEENDVFIVFNAGKYGRILVTNDGGSKTQPGGILGNAERLKQELKKLKLKVEVMRDVDAVGMVTRRIKDRNAHCRQSSQERNKPLPGWVGLD